jgi:hypothetical protein
MWIHDFKNFMAHKKLWFAMTNIGVINWRDTKTYGVKKNHGLPSLLGKCGVIKFTIISLLLPSLVKMVHYMVYMFTKGEVCLLGLFF